MKSGYAVDWQVCTRSVSSYSHLSTKSAPGSQDLVSRFTLDSATEFLFGRDVRSLSAGLPYPPDSELARLQMAKPEAADEFASAFLSAQTASAKRGRFQGLWALQEFWTDKVQLRKAAIDKFINPILLDAIQKKNENEKGQDDGKVSEEDTLLSQLLKVTDGTSHSARC